MAMTYGDADCPVCRRAYTRTHPRQEWCAECKRLDREGKLPRKCLRCGVSFEGHKGTSYCSRDCRKKVAEAADAAFESIKRQRRRTKAINYYLRHVAFNEDDL